MNKENCALKLVDEIILYYDARSKEHETTNSCLWKYFLTTLKIIRDVLIFLKICGKEMTHSMFEDKLQNCSPNQFEYRMKQMRIFVT